MIPAACVEVMKIMFAFRQDFPLAEYDETLMKFQNFYAKLNRLTSQFKSRCMARNPDSTKERILDSALDIFSNKGYHETRLDEVAQASDTSKGAIYFHFPNKERLFLALVDQFANLLERRIVSEIEKEDEGIERVKVALRTCLQTFAKYRRQTKIMLVQAVGLGISFEKKRLEITDRFADLIRIYLDEAVSVGDIQPVDTSLVAHAWMGAIYNIVIRWVHTGEPDQAHIMEVLVPLLLKSVGFEE